MSETRVITFQELITVKNNCGSCRVGVCTEADCKVWKSLTVEEVATKPEPVKSCGTCHHQARQARDALLTLGLTGDNLFARICEDLGRGLIHEARAQLDFLDMIVNEKWVAKVDPAKSCGTCGHSDLARYRTPCLSCHGANKWKAREE